MPSNSSGSTPVPVPVKATEAPVSWRRTVYPVPVRVTT